MNAFHHSGSDYKTRKNDNQQKGTQFYTLKQSFASSNLN
jgi:hypothetical protein